MSENSPLDLDAAAFEQLVIAELDRLPDDMVDGLDNVVFVVEDRPEDGSLDVLGLYDGWALTERDRYGSAGLRRDDHHHPAGGGRRPAGR